MPIPAAPPHPLIAEWAKALIGAVVGFFAAMIGEPLKAELTDRRTLRKLRRALYIEIAGNFSRVYTLATSPPGSEGQVTHLQRQLSSDVYTYGKSNPTLFYQLADAGDLENVCVAVQLLRDHKSWVDIRNPAQVALNILSLGLNRGKLDEGMLSAFVPEYAQPELQLLLRERWEDTADPRVKIRTDWMPPAPSSPSE